MNEELDKLLCAKRVLLRSFFNSLTSALTIQKVLTLGPKTKALLKNLMELRQLLYVLHSFDCVTFYSFLTSLLYNENSDNYFRKDIFNRLNLMYKSLMAVISNTVRVSIDNKNY